MPIHSTIRIMTFHTPKNYGAVLQAFSLMSYLKNLSDDVKIIDFNTPHLREIYPLIQKPNSAKQAAKQLMELLYLNEKKSKYSKFESFVKNELDLTERYESFDMLSTSPPEADFYFTGSDQVFNPNRIVEERRAFYLDFGAVETKRVSYAASFGVATVADEDKKEISGYLQKFHTISVREESGVKIVKELSGRDVKEVLDPVFLNDHLFWRNYAKPYRKEFEHYLFYYRLIGTNESDTAARNIAKKKGLKLVVMTDGLLKWHADCVLRDVGPQEFLYLMDHAEYVVTDSFHGVAFSLIFEKQFAFSDYNFKLSKRALNLLNHVGVGEVACVHGNSGEVNIDYKLVNSCIAEHIASSKQFIKWALEI